MEQFPLPTYRLRLGVEQLPTPTDRPPHAKRNRTDENGTVEQAHPSYKSYLEKIASCSISGPSPKPALTPPPLRGTERATRGVGNEKGAPISRGPFSEED